MLPLDLMKGVSLLGWPARVCPTQGLWGRGSHLPSWWTGVVAEGAGLGLECPSDLTPLYNGASGNTCSPGERGGSAQGSPCPQPAKMNSWRLVFLTPQVCDRQQRTGHLSGEKQAHGGTGGRP